MNIQQAKQEIIHTLQAYLSRDALGNYRIPVIRQRPVLLMGPPGIGKTQIMEQIAAQCGVGLVSYTITHHTRQSAMGLPFIDHRTYAGQEVSVTGYTMSEILSSVYDLMERTGLREGILFLDEINCVSETLAPMMLQFLQCKTFGNQRLPEGWLIAAAGNPPEYNRSVREFDVVTLDRVRRMDVEADYGVWKEYAAKRGLHGAVRSYLDIRRENFYRMENTVDGPRFATARGWEDLSELLTVYEELGIPADRDVISQYIQLPEVSRDFANYLELYDKYRRAYRVDEILRGTWEPVTVSELGAAPFDERLSVMGLLLSRLSGAAQAAWRQDALCVSLHGVLSAFKEKIQAENSLPGDTVPGDTVPEDTVPGDRAESPAAVLERLTEDRRRALEREREAGRLETEDRDRRQREIQWLEECVRALWETVNVLRDAGDTLWGAEGSLRDAEVEETGNLEADAMKTVRARFAVEVDRRAALGAEAGEQFDNAFRFLEDALGQGQELVLFVTEITAGFHTSWFVETFGCDAYFRHNRELLFENRRDRIREKIAAARKE